MNELTKAQKGRLAIRTFKITADALAMRGAYKPAGKSGQTLETALREISPEIYGTMNDPRSIEIAGLEYVLDRLPKGIEEATRIVLTAQEDLKDTAFEKIEPLKRRRISYRMSDQEICFVITRGLSEVYDVITHLTFLNIEARKIHAQMRDSSGDISSIWKELERNLENRDNLDVKQLDQAIWNLSILLGRTYQETKHTFDSLEKSKTEKGTNNGLFHIIYQLGLQVEEGIKSKDRELLIYYTPSFRDMIAHQKVSRDWARTVKNRLQELGLLERPLHVISANMHSVKNLLYAYAALDKNKEGKKKPDIFEFIKEHRTDDKKLNAYAAKHGMTEYTDNSGANINFQIFNTEKLKNVSLHPALKIDKKMIASDKPVILVMDYAFGTQAFEVMDELLAPIEPEMTRPVKNILSISIMGKAGILPGQKGDIMLATAHVMEGSSHNYLVNNDVSKADFDDSIDVYEGPIVTVLGTSLQNRDVLEKFQQTSWKAIGLEMEGGHYHRAISAAIIKGHINRKTKTRYAYYASDNPLKSGQTLASGGMGDEGIRPTYMIAKVFVEKILGGE